VKKFILELCLDFGEGGSRSKENAVEGGSRSRVCLEMRVETSTDELVRPHQWSRVLHGIQIGCRSVGSHFRGAMRQFSQKHFQAG
jgi:hypothetical protein